MFFIYEVGVMREECHRRRRRGVLSLILRGGNTGNRNERGGQPQRIENRHPSVPAWPPPRPLAGWARPLSQGLLFLKSPWCSHPRPKEQCQPQIRLRPGLGAQRRRGWGFRPPHSCRCNSGRAMRPGQPASQPHWVRRPRHAPDTGPKVLGVSPGARWRSSQRYTLHPVAWASQVAQW